VKNAVRNPMKNAMKNATRFAAMSAVILTSLGTSAQVSTNAKASASENTDPAAVEIKPGKAHEKCLPLDAEQTLQFRFDAVAKLNFYVRPAKGDATQQLLKLGETTSASGVFTAKSSEPHCMVWENRGEASVTLNYSSALVANLPENKEKGAEKIEKQERPEKVEKAEK
jgi:hypothetical protein